MLKWIAVLGNLGILGFVAYIVAEEGVPDLDDIEFWILAGLFAAPTANLWHIIVTSSSGSSSGDDENILTLWLRVKKSELRKRLD